MIFSFFHQKLELLQEEQDILPFQFKLHFLHISSILTYLILPAPSISTFYLLNSWTHVSTILGEGQINAYDF